MASFVFIWASLAGCYLLFAGEVSVEEGAAAGLCGLAGALWSLVIRHVGPRQFRFHRESASAILPGLRKLPGATVKVAIALVRAIASRKGGWVETEPFSFGRERAPADLARRAIVILARSIAPDSYVLRLEGNQVSAHSLVAPSHSPDPRWPV